MRGITVSLKQCLLFPDCTVLDCTLWKPQHSSRSACVIFASGVSLCTLCLEIEAKFKNCSPHIPKSDLKWGQVSVWFLINLGRLHEEMEFQEDESLREINVMSPPNSYNVLND